MRHETLIAAAWLGLATSSCLPALAQTSAAPSAAVSTNGLVLYYSFDKEDPGQVVADNSGNGRPGVAHSAVWTTNGARGGAVVLDGNSYISAGASSFSVNQSFTISAWACPAITHSYMRIFDSANGGDGWDLGLDQSGTRFVLYWSVPGHLVFVPADQPFRTGEWYHVVGTYDGKSGHLFVDGVGQRASGSGAYSQHATTHWMIGAYGNGNGEVGAPDKWVGRLDEIRLYDRVLSASEIMSLYLAGQPVVLSEEEEKAAVRLLAQLGADDSKTRRDAKTKLRAMGRRALPLLSRYRNDPDPEIRQSVRELLGP